MILKHVSKIFILLMVLSGVTASAQQSLKFEEGGGPSGSGPTTTNKTVTMYNGDAGVYEPPITVTFSLSNQQYPSIEGNSNTPGVVFGGGPNTSNSPPGNQPHYQTLNRVGGGASSHYSTNGATPPIDVANDYGVEIATYSDALIFSNGSNRVATNETVYFADLTLEFNRPVTNPILHFAGLGTQLTGPQNEERLGYSTSFDLVNSNYSFTRLAGTQSFSVNASSIRNSARQMGASQAATSGRQGAGGSVQVNGENITTLTLRVLVQGDGTTNRWAYTNSVSTDGFLMSVSLTTYTVSGSVFNDANGMRDNRINGDGTNAGGLNAVLVDENGDVVAAVPVDADGSYNFSSVPSGNYSLRITTEQANVGEPAPAVVLPDGWVSTGENLGSGEGNDGTADGILTNLSVNSNVSEANFAIQRPPATENAEQNIPTPQDGAISQGTLTTPVSGSDPEDGTLGNGSTIAVTELPTNGKLFYDGNEVAAGQVIENFDPGLLSFTELEGGSTSTSFKYSFVDAAGAQSDTPGTYTVTWDEALPVTFGPVKARIVKGELVVEWSTLEESNNDHFEVEVSNDGKTFRKIGAIDTKAKDGNSNEELQYDFSSPVNESMSVAGLSMLLAGLLMLFFNRRSKLLIMAFLIAGSGLFTASCKKTSPDSIEDNKLFVRIVQIDKDGGKKTSKTVQATRE